MACVAHAVRPPFHFETSNRVEEIEARPVAGTQSVTLVVIVAFRMWVEGCPASAEQLEELNAQEREMSKARQELRREINERREQRP